jgi:WD40 repeat protein
VGYLRKPHLFRAIRVALFVVAAREDFRIVHFSIQGDHLHLIVEASSREALWSGMKAFQISAAKRINAAITRRTGERRTGTVWTIKGAFARNAPAMVSRPAPADIVGFAYGPDGRSVLAADAAGTLGAWDLRNPAAPVEGPQQPLNSGRIQLMALSKDGSTVAVGGMDEVVLLLDVTGPEPVPLATIDEGGGTVQSLRFSPDGRTLAVGHLDGTKLFDLTVRKSPRQIARLVERGTVGSVEFSADGLLLGVTSGTSVSLYSLADRADPVRLSEISLGAITFAMAFSPDGRTMAVAPGLTGATTLWDIADLTQPHRLATVQAPDSTVFWMEFSPDGSTLATAGFGTLWLWDVADRSIPVRYASLSHPQLTTRNQMFSPDGRTLASGGGRRLFFWDSTVPEELSADPAGRACAITGRGLDPAEWATYVPELDYRPTC